MESKPAEPSTPWWVTLIAVFVTAVACVMGTAYALGAGPKPVGAPAGVSSLVADTITYFPHILLLFGVLADMFTYEGVYSIPSLVGILSIFGNWILRYFWRGIATILEKAKVIGSAEAVQKAGAPLSRTTGMGVGTRMDVATGMGDTKSFFKDYDGCNVQGFSSFASSYAPQTLVVTATVFMYYIFDNVSNRGWLNSVAAILFFVAVYVGQAFIIKSCPPPIGEKPFTMTQQALMALVEGMLMGGLSYATVAAYYPSRLPSSVVSPFPHRTRADLKMGPDGTYVDADGNPYVVLPNGQAVPDLSSMESRMKFADMAGKTLGTGEPALPGNCKA